VHVIRHEAVRNYLNTVITGSTQEFATDGVDD
jgi:hypothetical protein